MDRVFFLIGSLMAGLAVGAGAYGAHAGPALGTEQVIWIEKACRYQMYHSIALICVSLAISHRQQKAKLFGAAGCFFLLGIVLFSGSLYVLAFTGTNLGYIVPAGGIAFIVGWVLFAFAGFSDK